MTTDPTRDIPSDAGPPLDPGLLRAIHPSANRMAAAEGTFVQLLHQDIETLVRQLPDGGWGFCERTVRAVLWVILVGQPAEDVAECLRWLGSENQADGFPFSEYVSVGHALVRVAREMSAENWSTTTGSAWTRFFMWMQPYLRAAAQQVAAREEAAREEAARRQAFDRFARRGPADVVAPAVSDRRDGEDNDRQGQRGPGPAPGPAPGYDDIMMGMISRRRRRR
ncbi:MAG: hypothetical protein J2P26_00625 [Nocardiopsaceae bacterium]|nr:hypothetical protein [Nocardiopsaceae bacterium]